MNAVVDARPTLAVWKFASCDGCQLGLLDCEAELLALAGVVNIAHFTERSRASFAGPHDISLVEGSTRTPDESTPIAAHVRVDYELHGCTVDRSQLLEVLVATLVRRRPVITGHSVCQECKSRSTVCLLVSRSVPCLGPVTRAGCGALCPSLDRGCFGCFGPSDSANTTSLADRLRSLGASDAELSRLLQTFNAAAPAFRDEAVRVASTAVTLDQSPRRAEGGDRS